MKINKKIADGITGGLAGFFGPTVSYLIYYSFFGEKINAITIIPFLLITMVTSIIILIVLMRLFFKRKNQ